MTRFLHSKDDGFTLIELLIVIAIISILVSIVSLNVTGVMDQVNATAIQAETQSIQLAIDRYNTWDIGTGSTTTAITAQASAGKVMASSVAFGKYLTGDTKYCYTWGASGVSLTNQVCPP
jgi:prepilin-type N-terminal cleavage/methylation domain-containing protein